MKRARMTSDSLRSIACVSPTRCPYCSALAPAHWTRWGSYTRYSGDRRDRNHKVAVPRYWCKIKQRTFSLLPDGLLPYCGERTGCVLSWFHALFVQKVALSTLSRRASVPRGTLRHLKARFLRTVSVLRLPWGEGARGAAVFLQALAQKGQAAIVDLFRGWKEQEPKHCVVGIYVR